MRPTWAWRLPVRSFQQQQLLTMEVKVLSARCLKGPSSLLSGHLRPYVTLCIVSCDATREPFGAPLLPATPADAARGNHVLYRTRVDEHGAENPTWGDTFRLPIDHSFLYPAAAGGATPTVHLLVLSKRRFRGPARIGWCRIPACDIVDGIRPPSSVRRLSYALRNCRHGGRGHGVVDVAVRLVDSAIPFIPLPTAGQVVVPGSEFPRMQVPGLPAASGWAGDVAFGIPVQAFLQEPTRQAGRCGNQQPRVSD